jgi:hypothetical protein
VWKLSIAAMPTPRPTWIGLTPPLAAVENVLEVDAAGLEAGRVDVGDVVRHDVHEGLVVAERLHRREHRSDHLG